MLDHPIVDVALGLFLLYSTLSLVASVVKEWVSSVLGLRAKNLQKGIQTLIGKEHASRLYGHPLVSTLAKEKKSLYRCQFSGPGAVPNEALAARAVASIVIPPEHEPIERSLGLAL